MSIQNVMVTAGIAARRRSGVMAGLVVLVVLLALVSLGIGPVRLSPVSVIDALFGGGSDVQQVIVREIRLPRTILGFAIGAILGLAGAATALVMNLSSNPFAVLEIAFWLLGSLEDRSFWHVMLALPFIAAGAIILLRQRNAFRVLSLGEETAQSLGVDVGRLRLMVITGVALGVGGAVAVSGTIGFIGLVAPHLMRPLIGHDPTRLLVPSALTGSALLLSADIAVRIIPSTSDIKVGVLTSIIGVPFFLYLIRRERRALAGGVA